MSHAPLLFSTGSLYPFDTAYCFELAAEAGFDGVEVMCDARWSTRDPLYLRHLSVQHGLPIEVVHTPFGFELPGWPDPRDQLAVVHKTLELATTLGARSIVVHLPIRLGAVAVTTPASRLLLPWFFNTFAEVKRWMETELTAAQADTGVHIAIENMPMRRLLGWRVDPAHWNTVKAWSRVHSALTLDTTHWATFGIEPTDAYRAARRRVKHVHLSNFDGREHRLPQHGHLDLGAFLRVLAQDGYAGTVSLELHPDALEFEDATRVRQNLADSVVFCRTQASAQIPVKKTTPPGAKAYR